MGRYRPYAAELTLVLFTVIVGVLGFWSLYVGPRADPQPHHHLHVVTTFGWMSLLLLQMTLLANARGALHRRMGLAVLGAGPLLVASTTLLTVHSARTALASGQDDFLIVQNVLGTIWLALVLMAAFAFKRRRRVHGAFLNSTLITFLGPALFFALMAFAPPFRIEGPETFYRFQTAGWTAMGMALAIALVFVAKDWRNNWPYAFAAASYVVGEVVKPVLARLDLTDLLTRAVAAPSEAVAFVIALGAMAALLIPVALPTAPTKLISQAAPTGG